VIIGYAQELQDYYEGKERSGITNIKVSDETEIKPINNIYIGIISFSIGIFTGVLL